MNIREKILVIEDEKSIARFISTILTANGYEAMRAASGAEAMSMISSHCPDLVILDLGLPDMDGLDILRQLRSWSTLPVVVVSARSHEQDKVSALDLGADDYLTKPFSTGELLARIRALTRRKGEVEVDCLHFAELQLNRQTYDLIQGENRMKLSLNIRSWKCCCPTPNRSFPRNALSKRSGAMKAMSNITISRCISPSCEKN